MPPGFGPGGIFIFAAPSSIAIDAQDNVWVLHRPRTLKPDQIAMAAPPVIVFDGAGNFIKAWGGSGNGYEWPEREHGIHIDYKGFVWLGGNYCPLPGDVGLKPVTDDALLKFTQDGRFVMQIGRSNTPYHRIFWWFLHLAQPSRLGFLHFRDRYAVVRWSV